MSATNADGSIPPVTPTTSNVRTPVSAQRSILDYVRVGNNPIRELPAEVQREATQTPSLTTPILGGSSNDNPSLVLSVIQGDSSNFRRPKPLKTSNTILSEVLLLLNPLNVMSSVPYTHFMTTVNTSLSTMIPAKAVLSQMKVKTGDQEITDNVWGVFPVFQQAVVLFDDWGGIAEYKDEGYQLTLKTTVLCHVISEMVGIPVWFKGELLLPNRSIAIFMHCWLILCTGSRIYLHHYIRPIGASTSANAKIYLKLGFYFLYGMFGLVLSIYYWYRSYP
jgi:hypothetical protein